MRAQWHASPIWRARQQLFATESSRKTLAYLAPALTQNEALKMSMAVQEFFRQKVLTVAGVEEALRRDI